ncbi:DUF4823 domain-containing protein [Pinirhizobacter soli]|uniref:DUF4823 domain-containing protein n=1 Tax=Pinirhizobacter soli TaxID=2786953 RepID=UPI002029B6C0|nr:DUF4823 domain-containing protein [Pinirhizobacter soli]
MKRLFLVVLVSALVSACSVPRQVKEGGAVSGAHVMSTGKVLVLNVRDGQETGQDPAVGSGQGMVAALRKALAAHGVPLSTSADMDLQAGLASAQRAGYRYVLKCTITLWEDNATAWSGKGDKLNISVELYDAQTRELAAAATDKRTATGFTLASGSPDRFMDQVASGALGQIYGWPSK